MRHVLCPCPLRGKHEFQAGRWRETRRWLSLDLHLGKAMNEFLLGPGPQISGKRGFITVWVYELWGCMTFTKSKWSIGSCLRHCVCLKFINRIVNLPRPLWLRKLCNKVLLGYRIELPQGNKRHAGRISLQCRVAPRAAMVSVGHTEANPLMTTTVKQPDAGWKCSSKSSRRHPGISLVRVESSMMYRSFAFCSALTVFSIFVALIWNWLDLNSNRKTMGRILKSQHPCKKFVKISHQGALHPPAPFQGSFSWEALSWRSQPSCNPPASKVAMETN